MTLSRAPKFHRKAINHEPRLDEHKIIVHPLNTESVMKKIEEVGGESEEKEQESLQDLIKEAGLEKTFEADDRIGELVKKAVSKRTDDSKEK